MIEYSMKSLTADELSFKMTHIKAEPNTRFEIKPLFSRRIQGVNENPLIHFVTLECKVESTEESPKPFDLLVRLVGVFEVKNLQTDEDRRVFAVNATETMFPYLRAALTNLTADALIPPIVLPVVSGATLFPEDRGPASYTINFDPKTVN